MATTETSDRPDQVIKQFVDDVCGEFDAIHPVDYTPRDGDTFVCVEWNVSDDGREQITELQHRVTGVDRQFEDVDVDYANIARGYVKFQATNMG